MKHFRILLPVLILALVLSGCASQTREPYDYTVNSKTITVYPESATIVDGLNVYHYTREVTDSATRYEITYPNGGSYWWTATKNGGHGGWSDGYNENLYLSGRTLVDALRAGEPREKTGSPLLGFLLILLGGVNIFAPETMFYLRRGWMFKNAEPSDEALSFTRISGGSLIVFGLILCFI